MPIVVQAIARLENRSVLSVTGPDAVPFLQGLLTANVEQLNLGQATFAALLSPQGKILFDMFVVRTVDGFLIDCDAAQGAALIKRLGMYRLRSDVQLADRSSELWVLAIRGPIAPDALPADAICFVDPRLPALGQRAIVVADAAAGLVTETAEAYDELRVLSAIPASGVDFLLGDAVPHDVNLDDLGAVDFKKGCYVGQEIVSRMKHRGTARRRLLVVRPVGGKIRLPCPGTEIRVGDRAVGVMGSSVAGQGLALLRLDWVRDAQAKGLSISAEGVSFEVDLPSYATFGWPETPDGA